MRPKNLNLFLASDINELIHVNFSSSRILRKLKHREMRENLIIKSEFLEAVRISRIASFEFGTRNKDMNSTRLSSRVIKLSVSSVQLAIS